MPSGKKVPFLKASFGCFDTFLPFDEMKSDGKRQTQKNFIKLYLTCRSYAKVWLPETRLGSSFSLFSCQLKNVSWLAPTLTYQIPFALNIHVTAIKNISVVNLSFNPIAGREWDMMKNHEKLSTIWSWRRKIRSELLNPFFMLSLSDAFLRKRKSANAIWFSFICSRFFIFWFPLDREKLQYPFFMKANEKHSGLCARNVVSGKCLLNGFNHEWQVLACLENGFENGKKIRRVEKAARKLFSEVRKKSFFL